MSRRRFSTVVILLMMAGSLVFTVAGPAAAHVDFESSSPADGDVLTEPLERIELVFTGPTDPVPGGVQLIGATRAVAITVVQPSDDTVVIEPGQPVGQGQYAVIWAVESQADRHRIEGAFSFTIELPGPEPLENEPAAGTPAPTTTTTAPAAVTTTSLPMVSERLPAQAFETAVTTTPSQDEAAGRWVARFGRWAMMAGALLAIGAFVFAGTVLRGSEDEVRFVVRWIRRGGILVVLGTIVEVVGEATMRAGTARDALSQATLVDLLASSSGIAVLLRLAGGIALLQDPKLAATAVLGRSHTKPEGVASNGPAEDQGGTAVLTAPQTERFRLDMGKELVTLVGLLVVAASFVFNGHTAPTEHSALARSASVIHVLAAGVWFGGLAMMTATLMRRRRAKAPLDAAPMAIGFSWAATVAVVAAGAAGVVLAWTILDTPGELVSGTWGRLLVAKLALVIAVAIAGAYNHFKIVPALDQDPSNQEAAERLRKLVRLEAGLLVVVVALTAVLVGAAP